MRYTFSYIISILCHAAVFFILLSASAKGGTLGGSSPQPVHIRLVTLKPHEAGLGDPGSKVKAPDTRAIEEARHAKGSHPCSGYDGVGIYTSDLGIITIVAPGYPAALAGLKVDDYIGVESANRLRGPSGTKVAVTVVRGGVTLHFTITRGHVCTKSP